ncbi:hypothetical protein HMPREF3156_02526 [Neisseria sp. HMSC06F02]|nr:hypothetical protein HMPREF3156_02526 [Neisseria sp. HMSC06F02]
MLWNLGLVWVVVAEYGFIISLVPLVDSKPEYGFINIFASFVL